MFQIGFGLVFDSSEPSWWMNILRTVFSTIDTAIYTLISYMYQILFEIANSTIISQEILKDLYGRVQLILGVIMIFKFATSILQVIINPDLLNDAKKGTGKVISKVVVMLVLLVSIMPLNIPSEYAKKGSYNEYINNNGILFGTLYSLQHRILSNNTLEKVVFGTSSMTKNGITIDSKESGTRMAAYVLRGFVRPNLKSDASKSGLKSDDNYVCKSSDKITSESKHLLRTVTTIGGTLIGAKVGASAGAAVGSVVPVLGTTIGAAAGLVVGAGTGWLIDKVSAFISAAKIGGVYAIYANTDTTASSILDLINIECSDGYAFSYLPLVSSFCGIILLIALVGTCIDVAIRAIKLAVLRLIAPIPIISYVNPKSSENGSFANWVKMVTTTYLELFIRLLIIYFIMYIVTAIVEGKIDLGFANGAAGIVATIFIIIGLFLFIKQAPKFISDALGLKGMMGSVGLSGVLGGTAALLGGAGVKGALAAGVSSMQTANMAASEGKQAPPAWGAGSDLAAQIRTGDPKAKGGLVNSMNDRLMRDAGISVARKVYGVTANGLDLAKKKMFDDEKTLNRSQDRYDRFVRGQMDQAERSALIAQYGSVENARDALLSTVEANKKQYGMSKTNYEDAKKFGDSHRVTPSFEEEHRASWRERYHSRSRANRLTDRPDMFNSRGEGATAHQRGMDRIMGSRDDWSNVESPRVDNRWDPGVVRTLDENAIHDNPDRNIDTPQAGPPPGGPHP